MNENAKHTPEPWHEGAGNGERAIFGPENIRMRLEHSTTLYPICKVVTGWDDAEDRANGARIVACVNACEGIANPEAVPEMLLALEMIAKQCSQFEARCLIEEEYMGTVTVLDFLTDIRQFRAALAKARGEETGS